jgi:outer membrane protein assembly factor BamB
MFRHDPERSGSTASAIRPECELAWERQLGGALGGCTVTGDVTFVAVPARHMVQALRARDGSEIWSFVAGGRVDTPPTIHGGRALFGCADGWVYCVRASDGALVWRFRAAPKERLIGAFGDIESAWPVHGGVLVMAGEEAAVAYVAAGRSSFLDGGIWAYALDGETGRVVSEKQISTRHNLKVDPGHNWFDDTGQLADVLVAHGGGVYMRHQKLFDAAEGAGDTPSARGPLLATRGLRDDSWFSRTGWFLGDQPYGDYIVFAREAAYGVRARPELSVNGGFFRPGEQGYEVFAADRDPKQKPKSKRRPPESRWAVRVPVRVVAMALAGDVLLAAGTPDILDPMEPWAAHEGRRGGVLLAISTADGKVLREQKLDCAPAYDAMAAAGGRLFVGTRQGKLLCFR